MPEQQALVEASASLNEIRQGQPSKGRFRALLIRAGWGSSGYYSEAVLRRDGPQTWPVGTRMHLDHQTAQEAAERPEGSVMNWASEITSTPRWDPELRGLVAEIRVFPQWRELLNEEFASTVGLSIRAKGQAEYGEAEGRNGPIITSLDEGISVDWVTRAGAGGRVLQLIESARGELLRAATEAHMPPEQVAVDLAEARNVGHWIESRIHRGFTELCDDMFGEGRLTRDERISLSNAIGEGLTAFNAVVAEKVPHLYQRDLWDDPEPAPADVSETTSRDQAPQDVPAPPDTTIQEGAPMSEGTDKQGTPPDGGTTEVAESAAHAELAEARRQLAEARLQIVTIGENAQRATLAEAERDRYKADNDRLRAVIHAQDRLRTTLAESGLPDVSHARVTAVVCGVEGSNIPLNEAGKVDEESFTSGIAAAIQAEKTYIAGLAEAAGTGIPRGLGGGSESEVLSESALNDEMERVFSSIGMPADVAKAAATGRVAL
ncbi:hypothetical protein ACIBEJ_35025 [Nonomuraea sp. NPDC050790]|uniref:hypothetical protein n=1 Tax=Nonomuraea sp. NPDC050790 TaxID=3364371 RepID=UPI0037B1F122